MGNSGYKIVCTGPIGDVAIDILQPFGELVVAESFDHPSLLPLIPDAVALVVRGTEGVIDAGIIAAGRQLKVIGRTGVGYDNVDVAAATKRGIPVLHTPGANARAVAEGVVTYIMALAKRVPYWDQQLKAGNWRSRFESKPRDLEGAVLGIIGFGSIGGMVASLLRPFNMTVLAFDPFLLPEQAAEAGAELVELDTLLARSDYISLNAALTDEARQMLNRETIAKIKPGSCLINLARGGLIESLDVVYDALMDGTLAGVALDVYEPEPPDIRHPLFSHPAFLGAPHAMGMTPGAMNRIYEMLAVDIVAVLSGEVPRHVVNPEVLKDRSISAG